ncbi:MAG: hypothetical protein VB071_13075 [Lawsonibacter sp.]|nr:hypothetical protein [Lawsonibacter sp.]
MIAYFTGTGNSRYCAQMRADWFGDEFMDALVEYEKAGMGKMCYRCPEYEYGGETNEN